VKFAVVVFPGSNCEHDTFHVLKKVLNQEVVYAWHQETDLQGADAVLLPGGFAYGDHLRCGAIAKFSPIMESVKTHAAQGKLVLGICNGFQILQEAGLLPGVMLRNSGLKFVCRHVYLKTESIETPFTASCRPGQVLKIPIAHNEGNFFIAPEELAELDKNRQILFRYADESGDINAAANPNGSLSNIAGVMNRSGNVMGLMPHPERASEPLLGSEDGRQIFQSMVNWTGNT
jgi:phosphoribosylformylglycinamidine synthase I